VQQAAALFLVKNKSAGPVLSTMPFYHHAFLLCARPCAFAGRSGAVQQQQEDIPQAADGS
jgi:hypothetical protein